MQCRLYRPDWSIRAGHSIGPAACGVKGRLTCTALHCTALNCTALHCHALPCTAMHCTALHCTAYNGSPRLDRAMTRPGGFLPFPPGHTPLSCGVCTALHCTALHCTALHCLVVVCKRLLLSTRAPPVVDTVVSGKRIRLSKISLT
jgi:hypothetical protein